MFKRGWSFISSFLFISFISCATAQGLNIEDQLKNEGVVGEVHGAPHDLGHYVITIRDPEDFFKFEHYSLLSKDAAVKESFKSLKRHDKIRVWGATESYGPQKHLFATKLVVEEAAAELPKYERKTEFPANFPAPDTVFKALVHAVIKDKRLLVVEYKDAVLPVRVPASIELPDLYKNDVVEMKASIADHPGNPSHLRVSEITQKEALINIHGKPIEKTGVLVKFPKSPMVKFDVYAIKEDLEEGLSRQYTLINFENQELFAEIRTKLAKYWDAGDATQVVNGRNKLINPSVVIKAKGIGNMVDPGQANPQIILNSLEDISEVKK